MHTIDAHNVDYLVCHFENDPDSEICIKAENQNVCILYPMQLVSHSTLRKHILASMMQLPVLVNFGTTGHKLQGQTRDNLFIASWHYTQNWVYIVLSHVHSLEGLFLGKRLQWKDFCLHSKMVNMMDCFRQHK